MLNYLTGWGFGLVLAINLPFYYLAIKRRGGALRCAPLLLLAWSAVLRVTQGWVESQRAASRGADVRALMGIGMLMLFRHRTSLGGINILALYPQDKHGRGQAMCSSASTP